MTNVKDWHRCGQCKYFEEDEKDWFFCTERNEMTDPDMEACSDFEPKGGWQE